MPADITVSFDYTGPLFDPRTAELIHDRALQHMGELMGSILMPKMRGRIPVNTGALRRSLKIVIQKNQILIGFTPEGYYYLFQRGLPRDLINLWIDAVHDMTPIAFRRAIKEVLN